jgi:hypothetical protein
VLPYRTVGLPLDPDIAFVFATTLSLLCVAATVVATYLLGIAVTGGRRFVALLAAALYGLWPVLVLLIGGHRGTENGTWQNDLGLSVYSEPLSTALVAVGLVLVVRRRGAAAAAAGGVLLGLATAVRLSNALIAGCLVVGLIVLRDRKGALAFTAGGAALVPVVAAYWPKGYVKLPDRVFPPHPFALRYASSAWSDSLLWRPSVLIVLIPLALLGTLIANRAIAALLWSCVAVTALLYTFYVYTPLHPRFLFVVLPIVLVFWAAGAAALVLAARGRFADR